MDAIPKYSVEPEIEQPGLGQLREAVANYLEEHIPRPAKLRQDVLAGLTSAIGNVPEGMADSLLVGVNPVYGLYAGIMGPLVGALFSSTQLMMVTTTSAASLASGQALTALSGDARDNALFLMIILIGFSAGFTPPSISSLRGPMSCPEARSNSWIQIARCPS